MESPYDELSHHYAYQYEGLDEDGDSQVDALLEGGIVEEAGEHARDDGSGNDLLAGGAGESKDAARAEPPSPPPPPPPNHYSELPARPLPTQEDAQTDSTPVNGSMPALIPASPVKPSSPLFKNLLFQSYMDKVNDETVLEQEEAFEKLAQISRDFRAAAILYGQIIINERYLPNERKTIQPEAVGGIAGGDKYLVPNAGILFKFPNDDHGIYGGEEEECMKAASRELTSLVACWRLTHQIPNISFPLMTNIDFRGCRIIATLLLPINSLSGRGQWCLYPPQPLWPLY